MSFGKSLGHTVLYLLHLQEAHTQTTEEERDALQRYARGCERVAEIGVYQGVNTRLLAEVVAPEGTLYAIDPFFTGRLPICWGEIIARRHVRRGSVADRVEFIKKMSWEACSCLKGNFDFVFVDGDHSYEGVQRDWEDWSCRLNRGGVIAMHDTRVPAHNPSVAQLGSYRYFEEHIQQDGRFDLVEQVDSLSVLRRL